MLTMDSNFKCSQLTLIVTYKWSLFINDKPLRKYFEILQIKLFQDLMYIHTHWILDLRRISYYPITLLCDGFTLIAYQLRGIKVGQFCPVSPVMQNIVNT